MTDQKEDASCDNRDTFIARNADNIRIGDRIELGYVEAQNIDTDEPTGRRRWELVEVVELLTRAPSGHVRAKVKHADGRFSVESLARPWRMMMN